MIDRYTAMTQNRTPQGKQLGIAQVKGTALYAIKWEEGGELPEKLTGRYTNVDLAHDDIHAYLKQRWDEADRVQAKAENERQLNKERAQRGKAKEETDGATSAG